MAGHGAAGRLRPQLQCGSIPPSPGSSSGSRRCRHQHAVGTARDALSLINPLAPRTGGNDEQLRRAARLRARRRADVERRLSRDLRQVWNVGAGYTYTRGSSLDMLRAPNREPNGIRIEGVQPFLWQRRKDRRCCTRARSAPRRRPVKGIGAAPPTRSPARATTPRRSAAAASASPRTIRTSQAEWGLSSFDRRHQLSADVSIELPFGPNRPWLNHGGVWAALLKDWRATVTFTWQSGTPLHAARHGSIARRSPGHERHTARGLRRRAGPVNGSDDRSLFQHRRIQPPLARARFGTAEPNVMIGPGEPQVERAVLARPALRRHRVVTIQRNANDLLNMVTTGDRPVVNSPTFGQVLSVRRCNR